VDAEDSGDLKLTEFLTAMYFVDGLMHEKFSTLPTTVPFHIYEQAAHPIPDEPEAGPSNPLHHTHPRRYRNTRRSDKQKWPISLAIRANATTHLRTLDPSAKGRISKEAFMGYLDEQYLVEEDGLKIW
jgi:epidermal growth factor receptor substrate 15